jgi:hypothetical protein
MLAWPAAVCVLALAVLAAGAGVEALAAETTAPANDQQAAAQVVHTLPASLTGTTAGAGVEPLEAESQCAGTTGRSVWYTLRTPAAERVAVDMAAAGALDATVDVYHAVRSQLQDLACERTDPQGKASLTFMASKNGVYLIRVAALASSQAGAFGLDVFLPTPAVQPPGAPLPAGGRSGQVDRIQNINAAYSVTMHAGVSYLINLANRTPGGCVSGRLFAPGTRSFEEGSPLLTIRCGGYRLFTPGAGGSGRYSLELTPRSSRAGVQRFHLQIARAGATETAPGVLLANYARARAHLNGAGVAVLRLYRLDVTSHSDLTLRLHAPASAELNLQLRGENGRVLECQCGGSGAQTLRKQLEPGRYYAVVAVRGTSSATFTLERESRTITSTGLSFPAGPALPLRVLSIAVSVTPALSGLVTLEVERFDPVFGWQFYSQLHGFVSRGRASLAFTPPAVGRWRVSAAFAGSRTASPSSAGFRYLTVG